MKSSGTEDKEGSEVVWGVRAGIGVAVVGALALLAPIIWSAVSAGVGLLVLGGLGLVGVGVVQALPLLGQKWENRLLAARKAEARRNPIEQLQSFLLQKSHRVQVFKGAVSQIGTQIKSLEDMLAERKRKRPGYDASKHEHSVQAMRDAHGLLIKKYQGAERALTELQEVIEDKKFEWNFGQAGQAAIQSLNATSGQELLDQMLADEAFSSVRDNFNQVFADLELEAAKLSNARVLNFEGGMTIDLSAIDIPALERVKG